MSDPTENSEEKFENPSDAKFEKIKKEFLRIERELSELLFNAETFDEGRIVLKKKKEIEEKAVDKLRLLNDLHNLDKIHIQPPSKDKETKK